MFIFALVTIYLGIAKLLVSWVPYLLITLWVLFSIAIFVYLQKKMGQSHETSNENEEQAELSVSEDVNERDRKPHKKFLTMYFIISVGLVIGLCVMIGIGVAKDQNDAPSTQN